MKIAVISPLFSRHLELMQELETSFSDVTCNHDNRLKTKEDIIAFCKELMRQSWVEKSLMMIYWLSALP